MINPFRLKGVYTDGRRFYTKSLSPGKKVYNEVLLRQGGDEFRSWDPTRSKLAAALKKGVSQIGIKPGDLVLYLGASSGTTPSHVSDIVGEEGLVYALDIAPRTTRELVFLARDRKNLVPILADAGQPMTYMEMLTEVDAVYQDIAQRNQVEIFLKNCRTYLRPQGFGLLCVKARSVDVTKRPKDIFRAVRAELEKSVTIVDYRELDPFEKDHCIFIIKTQQ